MLRHLTRSVAMLIAMAISGTAANAQTRIEFTGTPSPLAVTLYALPLPEDTRALCVRLKARTVHLNALRLKGKVVNQSPPTMRTQVTPSGLTIHTQMNDTLQMSVHEIVIAEIVHRLKDRGEQC